jgi:hypothetical protein
VHVHEADELVVDLIQKRRNLKALETPSHPGPRVMMRMVDLLS